ncbi:non-homologous end-joining factor 1-like [Ornithodoros turicata]|uniref:non-homologous end-joining factor 1-like n=1 Tax=Ornithodoros turicata TaxID=34597 RepID=UPI003138D266
MAESDVSFDVAWHSYSCGDFHGLGKCIVSNGYLRLILTDLKRVYSESLNAEDLEERCKELNPGLEVTPSFLLKHLDLHTNSALRDNTSIPLKISEHGSEKLVLDLTSDVSGVPFIWKYCLIVQGADELYNMVTLPMVLMVAGLQKTQCELIKLLHTTDTEPRGPGPKLSQKKRNFDECTFFDQTLDTGMLRGSLGNVLKSTFNSSGEDLFRKFMRAYREGQLCEESVPPVIETSKNYFTEPDESTREKGGDLRPVTQTQACSTEFKAKKPKRNMRL